MNSATVFLSEVRSSTVAVIVRQSEPQGIRPGDHDRQEKRWNVAVWIISFN
jgi:hypothetical protein